MNHQQVEQTLIYIHQDIYALQERLTTINQALKTILSRVEAMQSVIKIEKESTGENNNANNHS